MSLLPDLTDAELSLLKGKNIIITGGASGIGKATVILAHSHGANITIADITEESGNALAEELGNRTIFHKTDISDWDSVLSLFEASTSAFGAIDVVCANAGTNAWDDVFNGEVDTSTGKLARPNLKNIEVNLHGTIHTAVAAVHYFQKNKDRRGCLVMTGSAASIIDTPPLHLYCAAKHGILGFMRGIRTRLLPEKNVTVNMVAPWMTVTPMLPQWIRDLWGDLPANDPVGVAKALLLPAVRPETNGKTLWVAGNRVTEVEDAMHETQTQWLGHDLSPKVDEGQRRMGII